ncbi:MAG: type II secretion system F family protein [Bythopirellula sp.]
MSESFPVFASIARWLSRPAWQFSRWTSTPWWPADTLASQQQALLQVLSVAVSERLEFAPLVTSLAMEHRGRYRRRLHRFAKRLAAGTSLADALEQTPGTLSDEQTLAIRIGSQSGTLIEVLRSLVAQREQSLNAIGHRFRQVGFYGALVGLLFVAVLTYIMLTIIPSFQAIMEDFDLEITEPLKLLIKASHSVVQLGPVIPLALLFCWAMVNSERPQRFLRRRVWSRFVKPVTQLRTASVLRLLAITQQTGRPLAGTISTLGRYHYDSKIRNKLLFVRNEVEQGTDLWKSLCDTRLLTAAESRVLESAVAAGTVDWTLRHLANWKRERALLRFNMYAEFMMPVVIILMASIVLLTALATLTPLFKLLYETG